MNQQVFPERNSIFIYTTRGEDVAGCMRQISFERKTPVGTEEED